MNIEQLSELSYKELQSKAKALSIAANQKKDILVTEISSKLQENDENSPVVSSEPILIELKAANTIPATPLGVRSMRTTRSTAKKLAVVKSSDVEAVTAELNSIDLTSQKEDVIDTMKLESTIVSIPEELRPASMSCASTKSNKSLVGEIPTNTEDEDEEEEGEYPDPTTLFEDEEEVEEEYFDEEYFEEEVYADGEEEEEEEEVERNTTDARGRKIAINRHVFFTSPDAKGSVKEVVAEKEGESRMHMHFTSPDLQMGKAVHWTYDEYNSSSAPAQKLNQESSHSVSKEEAIEKPRLPVGHADKVMNFWLTKAFSKPASNFFK